MDKSRISISCWNKIIIKKYSHYKKSMKIILNHLNKNQIKKYQKMIILSLKKLNTNRKINISKNNLIKSN